MTEGIQRDQTPTNPSGILSCRTPRKRGKSQGDRELNTRPIESKPAPLASQPSHPSVALIQLILHKYYIKNGSVYNKNKLIIAASLNIGVRMTRCYFASSPLTDVAIQNPSRYVHRHQEIKKKLLSRTKS